MTIQRSWRQEGSPRSWAGGSGGGVKHQAGVGTVLGEGYLEGMDEKDWQEGKRA